MNHFIFNTNALENVNAKFNEKAKSLLDAFFLPTKNKLKDHYIPVGLYKKEQAKEYSSPDSEFRQNIVDTLDIKNISFPEGLSDYEKILFSHFFYGEDKTYIISGAMGSGKSTSINYVLESGIEIDKFADALYIKIDFSDGSHGIDQIENIDKSIENFHDFLYDALKTNLIDKIKKFELCTDFLAYVKDNSIHYYKFFDFHFENIEMNYENWDKLSENVKVFNIFKFIKEKCADNKEAMVGMVMGFLKFINLTLNKKKIKTIIFYDNMDKLGPAIQRAILIKILALNELASVTKIITFRRSTKAKFEKLLSTPLFENQAQYAYNHIYHHGPSPKIIFTTKLTKLIKSIDKSESFSVLSEVEKSAIKNRASEIIENFTHQKSALEEAFSTITGECNRLALTLASRPFCNTVVPYSDLAKNPQELIRTFYMASQNCHRMDPHDLYVCNLFAGKDYNFTYINIIILSIIRKVENDNDHHDFLNISIMYDLLHAVCRYKPSEILHAFNYLMLNKRALVGGEYAQKYADIDQLIRSNDKLRLTELGDKYFNQTNKTNSAYIEGCLLSINWPFIANDFLKPHTILNRFKDLRLCIDHLKHEEESRSINFTHFESQMFKMDFLRNSIAIRIACNICKSFLNILPSTDESQNELHAWYSLFILWETEGYQVAGTIDLIEDKLGI